MTATLLKRRSGVAAKRAVGKARRHFRVRRNISGTVERPRLVVTRSLRNITAQVVDDIGDLVGSIAIEMIVVLRSHLESFQLSAES